MHAFEEYFESKPLIGKSPAFLKEISKIPMIAGCNSSVLISGETGTGKEVCAQNIHALGSRKNNPFVPLNCGAVPIELAENELFGHRSGAFTGAANAKSGLVQEAEGGTLFLDEIDSLPHMAQVKFLRFLQEKTYRPLGSTKEHQANVRVIAATGMDAEEAVKSGKLRRDLYYRLNVLTLKLSPLRKRGEDIPLLAQHFIRKFSAEQGKQVAGLTPQAMKELMLYSWPGNVRELEHVIERAVVLTKDKIIRSSDLSFSHFKTSFDELPFKEAKALFVQQFESAYIEKLLLIYQGNISHAARAARKHRRAFWQLIQKHQIDVQRFK